MLTLSFQVSSVITSLACLLVFMMPEIFSYSTKSPLPHRHHHSQQHISDRRSSGSRGNTISQLLEKIEVLEQYERYLQHLFLRGLLSEDHIERLGEILHDFSSVLNRKMSSENKSIFDNVFKSFSHEFR